jgi:HEPN domain-containing protein
MATVDPRDHEIVKVFHFIRWARADYVAARTLLRSGLLVQGGSLANTAIEKFLKAQCLQLGVATGKTHDVVKLYEKIKAHAKRPIALNEGFLHLLKKVYEFRYPDELPIGFNISMNQAKTLAQLDRSVYEISNRFEFNDKDRELLIEESALKPEKEFLEENVAVEPSLVDSLFNKPSRSYDYRNRVPIFMETHYFSPSVPDDGRFEIEGLLIGPNSGFILGQPRGEGKMFLSHLF